MFFREIGKTCLGLFASVAMVGVLVACGDDDETKEHNWSVSIPSMVVANGENFTTLPNGYSDYDFGVNYYWDGTFIQTTGKSSGLNFPINNQSLGDHILKIEFTGDAQGTSEYYIQVYEKEMGFLGASIYPFNRELKNGETLQGDVIFYPGTSKDGFLTESTSESRTYQKWDGTIKSVRFLIDDKDSEPVQVLSSAPWHFSIPVKGLSRGTHKLFIDVEGVNLLVNTVAQGGGIGFQLNLPREYIFTVTQ